MIRNNDKRPFLLAFAIAFLMILALVYQPGLAQESVSNVDGFFITRDGKTVIFSRVHHNSKTIRFTYGPENKQTDIPLAMVEQITFGDDRKSAIISLKDGRIVQGLDVRNSKNVEVFEYFYFDDIARKENYSRVSFASLSKMITGEHAGLFRLCPHCSSTWPDSYLYCPHDGVKTLWHEP